MRLLLGLLLAFVLAGCSAEIVTAHTPVELRVVVDSGGTPLKDVAGTEYQVGPEKLVISRFTGINTGFDDQRGSYVVQLTLPDEEKAKYGKFTEENLEKRIAVVVAGTVRSVRTILSPILDGNFQIAGRLTGAQVKEIAKAIKGD